MDKLIRTDPFMKYRLYVYDKPGAKGEPQRETIMLLYPQDCDLSQILHGIGLKLVMERRKNVDGWDGLAFSELMDSLTPEMLAPFRVHMARSSEDAIQIDNDSPVIGQYELKSYRGIYRDAQQSLRKMRDYAARFARRLEKEKANKNPAVSGWDSAVICSKALSWGGQFVMEDAKDFELFLQKKLPGIVPPMPVVAADSEDAVSKPVA